MDFAISSKTALFGKKSKIIFRFIQANFLATYRQHHQWSLPDCIIYYISKNPSSQKIYQKMIQCCKYFFTKNPLLIVSRVLIKYNGKTCNILFNTKHADVNNMKTKIWITDELFAESDTSTAQTSLSSIVTKSFQSNIKRLHLINQNISFNDLHFVASKCEDTCFINLIVANDDFAILGLEKIIEIIPKTKKFWYSLGNYASEIITSNTVKKITEFPHFSKITNFSLCGIPESFDIDPFYDYIKRNNITKIRLYFCDQISEAYKAHLQQIVNEIIALDHHAFKPPLIRFSGADLISDETLLKLFYRF